jgi:lysophospholipase L1-like esterase
VLSRVGWPRVSDDAGLLRHVLAGAVGAGLIQLGVLGLVVAAAGFALGRLERRAGRPLRGPAGFFVLKLAVAAVVGFAAGEAGLRLLYSEGETFSSHGGPLVRRFERDFRLNSHDGSRGPELTGSKEPGAVHVVVQGDSITWGQGVRDERELYTSRLLERLRQDNPAVAMAVLAYPGREIDGHLAELHRRGPELQPDLIIYQWFVNDMELDKSGRPSRELPWHKLFFHEPFQQYSYFWFFVDNRLGPLWPRRGPSYRDYIQERFAGDGGAWARFADVFDRWAVEATRLSPRVLVVLYPFDAPQFGHAAIHRRVEAQAARAGLASLDLIATVPELAAAGGLAASPFDPHPGPEGHRLIAEAIHARIGELWPEIARPAPSPADVDSP